MNILRSMAVKDVEAATRAIPVIDFGPALRGEPGALESVAGRVRRASREVGFFYLAGHGVPPAVVHAAFEASREFHALPLDEKMRLRLNENNIRYLAVNQSIERASTVHAATRPNYNESFFISHDRGPDHPDVVARTPLRGRNQWPAGHGGMRAAMVRYFETLVTPPTTSSSARGRTPTTRSSRSSRARMCRGSPSASRPGNGWRRRSSRERSW